MLSHSAYITFSPPHIALPFASPPIYTCILHSHTHCDVRAYIARETRATVRCFSFFCHIYSLRAQGFCTVYIYIYIFSDNPVAYTFNLLLVLTDIYIQNRRFGSINSNGDCINQWKPPLSEAIKAHLHTHIYIYTHSLYRSFAPRDWVTHRARLMHLHPIKSRSSAKKGAKANWNSSLCAHMYI